MSSNEEAKIRKLVDWATNFPAAKQYLPALQKMRNGPLKDFIDKHVITSLKSDDWIKIMETHFELEELRQQLQKEKRSLEKEQQDLNVLRSSLSKLKQQEEELEKEVSGELFGLMSLSEEKSNSSWTAVKDKISLLLDEAEVERTHLICSESNSLRSEIDTIIGAAERDNPVSNFQSFHKLEKLNGSLDEIKRLLSHSLQLTAVPAFRQKALNYAARADESLNKVKPDDIHELSEWFRSDLELDKRTFLSDVDEMKTDEKVSLMQKLVEEWTERHVQLFFENYELKGSLTQAKDDVYQKRLASNNGLERILDILIADKKQEAISRHLHSIQHLSNDSEPKSGNVNGVRNDFYPSNNPSNVDQKDDEFNFAVACSLLKTWPNAKLVYQRGVDNGNSTTQNWTEVSDKLKTEMYITKLDEFGRLTLTSQNQK